MGKEQGLFYSSRHLRIKSNGMWLNLFDFYCFVNKEQNLKHCVGSTLLMVFIFVSLILYRYVCFVGDVGTVLRIVLVRMTRLRAPSCVTIAAKQGIHLLNVPSPFMMVVCQSVDLMMLHVALHSPFDLFSKSFLFWMNL